MGSSTNDSNLIIISNGEKAYYSCHKGVGNILFDLELGIFTGKKPIAKDALNNLGEYSWLEWLKRHKKPLSSNKASYGYLVINYDTKTIISRSGYAEPNYFNTQWILQSLRSIFEKKSDENIISDESIIYMFNNGYMKMQNREHELFDFTISLEDFYKKTKDYVYKSFWLHEIFPEFKELHQIFITLPDDWTLINQEEDIDNYDNELKEILK